MQRGSAIPLHRGAATFADPARGYAHPAASTEGSLWIMLALVFGAVTFNMGLCFLNTGFITVSNLHVIGCEAIIITATLLYAYKELNQAHLLLIGGIVLWTLLLSSLRVIFMTDDAFDIKIVRDLIIPIAFFLLGLRVKNLKHADFIVRVIVLVVLGFALFEYFALDAFIKYFSVAKYYIARGTMEAKQALQSADLFVSGMRPAGAEGGRNLFPFLGDHRVSSVFLEPVSLGNFGVIVAIWAIVRSKFGDSYQIGLLLAAFVLIVLADSRFGAYLCILAFVLMLFPLGLATAGVVVLPLVALVVLIITPLVVTGSFVLAAQILGEFDVWTWLGLRAAQRQTFDSGYAYTISGIGVIGLTALWSILFAAKGPDRQYYTLRNLMALYYGTILCVSNSPYTIKTASLTWFLIGAAAAVKPKQPMENVENQKPAVNAGAMPIPLHGRVRFKERTNSAV
ncbi:MAG: hypothetical protein J0H17_00470 [Rhizobiales bacterium]|nr:hypothetical protein [Hyphomicrobiales bacterium]